MGICGLGSSGLNELMHSLYGMERRGIGEIKLNGKNFSGKKPSESMKQGVAYLTHDRHENGLINFRSLAENITVSVLRRISNWTLIRKSEERNIATDQIDKLKIHPPDLEKAIECHDSKEYLAGWDLAKNTTVRHMQVVEGFSTE